jgi:drug/metabolite transporter (DMT)-like permease
VWWAAWLYAFLVDAKIFVVFAVKIRCPPYLQLLFVACAASASSQWAWQRPEVTSPGALMMRNALYPTGPDVYACLLFAYVAVVHYGPICVATFRTASIRLGCVARSALLLMGASGLIALHFMNGASNRLEQHFPVFACSLPLVAVLTVVLPIQCAPLAFVGRNALGCLAMEQVTQGLFMDPIAPGISFGNCLILPPFHSVHLWPAPMTTVVAVFGAYAILHAFLLGPLPQTFLLQIIAFCRSVVDLVSKAAAACWTGVDQRNRHLGLVAVRCSTAMMCSSWAIMQHINKQFRIPTSELAFIRPAVSMTFCLAPIMYWQGIPLSPEGKLFRHVLLRAGFGGAGGILHSLAVPLLPFVNLQALGQTSIAMVALVEPLVFWEFMPRFVPAGVTFAGAGTVILSMSLPSGGASDSLLGFSFVLLGAASMATAYIFQRKAKAAHPLQLTAWVMIMQLAFAFGCHSQSWEWPSLAAWRPIFAMCLATVTYLVLLSWGSKFLTATEVSFLMCADPIYALVWQACFFNQMPSGMAIFGAALIVLAATVIISAGIVSFSHLGTSNHKP